VRVLAAGLTASARPDLLTPGQDFALVIDNAELPPAAPVDVVGVGGRVLRARTPPGWTRRSTPC
jgi:hypothetical protein